MSSLEEEIPAFTMWQIFYDTMSRLLSLECSESSIKHLANIVNSQELARILVYSHDPQLSFEQYEEKSQKYKAFTVWLLGQFFYSLNFFKHTRIHEIAINAQLKILYQISITQPHVYQELTKEYCTILQELNKYDGKDVLKFTVFAPIQFNDLTKVINLRPTDIEINSSLACVELKSKTLVIIEHIVITNLSSYYLNEQLYDCFDSLIVIVKKDPLEIKLTVLEIYCKLLCIRIIDIDELPGRMKEKLNYILGTLEQLVYDLYNLKIKVSNETFQVMEKILLILFENQSRQNFNNKIRISKFITNKILNSDFKISDELKLASCNFFLHHSIDKISECKVNLTENLFSNSLIKLLFLEKITINEIKMFINEQNINNLTLKVESISKTWFSFLSSLKSTLLKFDCKQRCEMPDTLKLISKVFDVILKIKLTIEDFIVNRMKVRNIGQEYFVESEVLSLLFAFVNNHIQQCKTQFPHEIFIKIVMAIPLCSSNENLHLVVHIVGHPFLPLLYKSNNELPVNIIGSCNRIESQRNMKMLYNSLALLEESKEVALKNICCLMALLSTGLMNKLDDVIKDKLGEIFLKIFSDVLLKSSVDMWCTLAQNSPHVISYLKDIDFTQRMLLQLISTQEEFVLTEISKVLPQIVCSMYSDNIKLLCGTELAGNACLSLNYVCIDCTFSNIEEKDIFKCIIESGGNNKVIVVCDTDKTNIESDRTNQIFKILWKLHQTENRKLKVNFINSLPALAKHFLMFHSTQITEEWIVYAGDNDKIVRKALSEVILSILESSQMNSELSNERKEEIFNVCFLTLHKLTKKSLQYSDYDLQDTLLKTIDNITNLRTKSITLRVMKTLMYFIMIPTSKYSAIAANILNEMANKQGTKTRLLYTTYRKEVCQWIAQLCAVNQALIKYDLINSLEKVSLVLGFFGTKHFIISENAHLLPFFVALIVQMPQVTTLIKEIAILVDVELSELLTSNYSNIFLHIFLTDTESVFKNSMNYLEQTTGLKGPVLRKRNLRTILNELLLNFYEKQDRVLLALKLLSREDTEGQVANIKNIPDYLQPRFLGVLYHFDTKLTKLQVLLSLVQIFKFMGPKNIAPFRFKIIAMLRTALLNYSPELNCDVWDAFIRSCDIEALGPQLGTIFVSLLSLNRLKCENKMDEIFRYLVIDSKYCLKDYIPDLFFVLDFDINHEIHSVIRKHMISFENFAFNEQLSWLMKYLMHETNEIKIYALKFLKKMMEKNREELDQMILGYNGIDSIIIELLDILMNGCRSKDQVLKSTCGECIGELGAIEPSHLPRKYTQAQSFTFFITEDAFILNSLNELVRAFQAEKNTKCMDRFALAIQETLKYYGISPDGTSVRHNLWKSFSQSQQELMLPLLSSRYVIGQSIEPVNVSPIYGSSFGTTFRSWIYNWTWSLINVIKPDKQNLLEVYLPSLKDDHRILMHFLPHIFLHALLEGTQEEQEKTYNECVAVISSFNTKKPIDDDLLYSRKLRTSHFTLKVLNQTSIEDMQHSQCTKVVFVLLDFLDRWLREWEWTRQAAGREHEDYKMIRLFLSKFCKLQLAKCNFQCEEYPRALMYLEDYIIKYPNELQKHLSFLAEIYARLDEPDAVAGVTALQHSEPSLEQKILALEVSGKFSDALACYECIVPPLKLHHLQGLIRCYLDLDNVNTAFNFAEGAMEKQPEYKCMLLEMQAETLWRLGNYEALNSLLKRPELDNNDSWGVQIGRSLLHLKNGRKDEFHAALSALRSQQVNYLSATSLEEGAYQHGYGFISKLHALNELEQIGKTICDLLLKSNDQDACRSVMTKLTSEWELRIKVVQESIKIIEPVLCLRKVALQITKQIVQEKVPHAVPLINLLLGETWLYSVKIARRSGVHQQAYSYTLKAEEYSPACLFLEKAKLHWMRKEHEQALSILRRGLEKILPENMDHVSPSEYLTTEQKKICAEAKLLFATYNDNISNVDTEVNIKYYKEAVEVFREWEKSLISLAQYYDRVFQTLSDEDKDVKGSDMQIHMINYFGKSLQYGTSFVYQSMPRLLSIWFDYGTRLLDVTSPTVKEERKNNLLKMTKLIDTFLERLPTYIFLTAFSQIVSRICHPQKEVYIELKSIISKMILQYPQQSMWMIISVIKSNYTLRSKRCAEILGDAKLRSSSMTKLVGDFTKLAEKLIELCNKDVSDGVNTTSVSTLLRTLPRLLSKDDFSEIMIPTQRFRKLVLPNPDFKSSQHNPFPNHYVHIVGIEDEVVILASLQKPKKITLRGSDGKGYIQMLKPKDDLRRDFRLMEFNDVVNQLLSQEADSRQRRLSIRLYSVAPLNEECGLIEWVPNLVGLRPVLMNLYKLRGLGMRGKELKEACCNIKDSLAKKRTVFLDKLLVRHPPILSEWFRKTFPDVQGWLTARTAYTRTTAVISMVGYILGLGDRHGENILLDSTSGDTVHVDFNCLFNKGETFEWPERVPFRLTHNMVSAMGPLGVEGIFRKSCACTLRVLRTYTNTLMSIVTPFVYDPLVSWPRNISAATSAHNSERTNEQALEHIRNIELRLQGMVRTKGRSISIPLSVKGQTTNVILEAMNVDNLCQMYMGWTAYL